MVRSFLIFLLMVLSSAAFCAGAPAATPTTRPNFLFVLIDDMGYRDLSCFGGTRVQTPEIDRLAREGIKFNQFYVQCICSPSRVALTTGQYPNRWHITSYLDTRQLDKQRGQADWLPADAPSLARFLRAGGYYTAHARQRHIGGERHVAGPPPLNPYRV